MPCLCILFPLLTIMLTPLANQSQRTEQPHGKTTSKSVELHQIELLVELPRETNAGHPLKVVVTVRNRSQEKVTFDHGFWRASMKWSVLDAKNARVPLTRYGQQMIGETEGIRIEDGPLVPDLVAPGKSVNEAMNLARLFDLSMEGDYKLAVMRAVRVRGKTRGIELEVKNIRFRIANPQKKN